MARGIYRVCISSGAIVNHSDCRARQWMTLIRLVTRNEATARINRIIVEMETRTSRLVN